MKILVVAATESEVSPLISEFGISISEFWGSVNLKERISETGTLTIKSEIEHPISEITVLITGIGMTATAFSLGKHLSTNTYDLVVNLGIAGSFDRDIALGEVLETTEDSFSELGAEDDNQFLPIEELGFGKGTFYPTTEISNLYNLFNTFNLQKARAITVNTVHGNEASITKVAARLNPQLESMEGAAFFYVCQAMSVPCLQIRAVSNYVEKRNRDSWKIGLAIKNLNTFAIEFLKLYA